MTKRTHIEKLVSESIYIMREAVSEAKNPVMLYSVGKDSAVMLHIAKKHFFQESSFSITSCRYQMEI